MYTSEDPVHYVIPVRMYRQEKIGACASCIPFLKIYKVRKQYIQWQKTSRYMFRVQNVSTGKLQHTPGIPEVHSCVPCIPYAFCGFVFYFKCIVSLTGKTSGGTLYTFDVITNNMHYIVCNICEYIRKVNTPSLLRIFMGVYIYFHCGFTF